MEKNINYDERAAEYIEALKAQHVEPTWDLVHTAYITGGLDADNQGIEYGDWKTRLKAEQQCLKEKLVKLIEFINSEKFYQLSQNNRQLLLNQKIAMELYLSVLNIRLFEDVDNIVVPDLGMIQMMGSVFGNTWNKPLMQGNNKLVEQEEFKTTSVDKTPIVS